MSDPNGIIANNPIPINDDNSEVDKTIILKENLMMTSLKIEAVEVLQSFYLMR